MIRIMRKLFSSVSLLNVHANVTRVVVKEGNDATLPCSLSTRQNITSELFDWKKDGQKEVFLYAGGETYSNGRMGQDAQFTNRVSHFPEELSHGNSSIIIRDAEVADSGSYTCDFPHLEQKSYIWLVVSEYIIISFGFQTLISPKAWFNSFSLSCKFSQFSA
uniref:Ig-like domain-containing protein n=1 Tax=Lates calcarifer TaxID=8187 RepID=A0A4W6BYS5_LATCA